MAIDIPTDITRGQAIVMVRSVLDEMGTPQPEDDGRAVCFCGEPVEVPNLMITRSTVTRVPEQRAPSLLEAARGS